MLFRLCLLAVLLACSVNAIQIKPAYGPPPQRLPHREYGVPQQMPFREYGPPALKYGPPKLNFIGGGGSSSGFHEQIKNHYGAPKPFYGPPHKLQHGPSSQLFTSPAKPISSFGPPTLNLFPKPAGLFGPPPAQKLPLFQPAGQFNGAHQPATSYGPPPSGPLNVPAKQTFRPPPPLSNYGSPPLPSFNKKPETTIIVTEQQNSQSQQHQQHQQQHLQLQQHQRPQHQIQIDASGHTHSVAGSQTPFHTACDGWKPITSLAGTFIENNHIDTQSGYSQVAQGQAQSQAHAHALAASTSSQQATQYSGTAIPSGGTGFGSNVLGGTGPGGNIGEGGNSIIDGLTDEQLVAVALQSSTFDTDNVIKHQENLPSPAPPGDFNKPGLNSLGAEDLQLSLGSFDNSYNKPPADSYAPGSGYAHEFHQQSNSQSNSHSSFGFSSPAQNLGPPPPPPPQPSSGKFGTPPRPSGNFGPPPAHSVGSYGPPPPPNGNYGSSPPPPRPASNYGPPPPPNGNYGPPPPPPPTGSYGPPPGSNYGPPPPSPTGNYGPPHNTALGAAEFVQHHAQNGLGIKYGKQTGNLGPFPQQGGAQPSKPVAYRPPVPQGLFEAISATVQHLDKFGVKPQVQAPTYIPPAASEIPQTGPGNLDAEYGVPHQQQQQQLPQNIIEQQLPQQSSATGFVEQQHQQSIHQQQQFGNAHAEYGAPALPAGAHQGPPSQNYLPPPPPGQLQQQYLPPSGPEQQQFNNAASYTSSATAGFDSHAFAASQYNQVQQQQQPRFHDCGHGPNFIDADSLNFQQQQQQQQYSSSSGTSISQSIPVAEQHTHFISGPASSYGPPPSGNNELDHAGYASEKSQVNVFPDGTNPKSLPGLDNLNVLAAQKSEAIHFSSQQTTHNNNDYQLQFDGNGPNSVNHEEFLSADLLQTILNAVEKPQQQHQPLPANHKAESRSDTDIQQDPIEAEAEVDTENEDDKDPELVKPDFEKQQIEDDDTSSETDATVQEITPIVVKDENELKH